MNLNRRTSYNIKENFLIELMKDRGVLPASQEEQERFFHPIRENELKPELLDNMEEGFQLLMKHMHGSKILLVVDPDVDGYTSSAVMWLFMQEHLAKYSDFNFTLDYHIPEGKEHGLELIVENLLESKQYDLILCPDSSSNDYLFHEQLSTMGYDILVLDHHESPFYSTYATVINNQLSSNYSNKCLSGVGIVYKFIEYIEKRINESADEISPPLPKFIACHEDYLDLVALGCVSDVMNMTTLENRWIVDYGLSHINNKFFKELIEKQSFSLKLNEVPLNQVGVAFYITPLINALIRVGNPLEKERLFLAFINPEREVESTKRGEKGQFETICTQSVRNCVNAKSRQTRDRDKAAELLDIQILENCLDDNKILILNADDLGISTTLTGLCAMVVAAKYKKPVMLGRYTSDGKLFRGSIRNKDGSPLKDFKKFLTDSHMLDYVEGHASAAGFALASSNINKLLTYANQKLIDYNFNEGSYDCDFIINNSEVDMSALIKNLSKGEKFFGQGNPSPLIAVEGIRLDKNEISIIGSNEDTLRFKYNNITYIKFKASELISQIESLKGKFLINVVGKPAINRWQGMEIPQLQIEDIEIKELIGF